MGIDPHVLGNHKLNTSSIASLAHDLSTILDVQVTYGYYAAEEPFDTVVIGVAGEGKSQEIFLMEDDYLHTDREPGDENGVQYNCSGFDDGTGCVRWITIYKDCFYAPAYFIGRWTWYYFTFTGNDDNWQYMLEYRRKIFGEIALFGGENAVIHADSGSIDVMELDPYNHSFSAIVEDIKMHPSFLDVSAWLRDGEAPFPKNPLVFLDDFSYWPTVEQMNKRVKQGGMIIARK